MSLNLQNQIVFWNIGQGQWITAIDSKNCYHFDVGGEFFNPKNISESCSKKQNIIYYSHWDWDHIGLTSKLKNFQRVCIAVRPQGVAKSYKLATLKIPLCEKAYSFVEKLKFNYPKSKLDNDLSQIFIYKNKLLSPGDSTKKIEKIWSPLLRNRRIKWLSVSHHGSNTSTSEFFLKNTKINQAIISARKKAYGHPHKEVLRRLKAHRVPSIRTEEWGNIRILTN
ncbi:MAG: hydrolase [Bdellovibrionota bacterium]